MGVPSRSRMMHKAHQTPAFTESREEKLKWLLRDSDLVGVTLKRKGEVCVRMGEGGVVKETGTKEGGRDIYPRGTKDREETDVARANGDKGETPR